jgi:hypothetical protein
MPARVLVRGSTAVATRTDSFHALLSISGSPHLVLCKYRAINASSPVLHKIFVHDSSQVVNSRYIALSNELGQTVTKLTEAVWDETDGNVRLRFQQLLNFHEWLKQHRNVLHHFPLLGS